MKMVNKFLKMLVIVISLAMPFAAYGQSSYKLYLKGETLMESGKYNDAINAFNAAMKMDSDLETTCKIKIRQCKEKISQKSKPNETNPTNATTPSSYSLTIDKEIVEFGCETRTAVYIKVYSTPKAWDAKSEADWCTVTASGNSASISCEINKSVSLRTTKVILSNGYSEEEVIVVQEGQRPYIKLEYETIEFERKGGATELKVISNTEWEISEIPEWCKVSYTKDGDLVLRVDQTKPRREGKLTVKTKEGGESATANIIQKGKKFLGMEYYKRQ